MGTHLVVNPGPGINYAEVVGDLRSRAAKLTECADVLEGFIGREEPAAVVKASQAMAAPPPVTKRKARNFEEFLHRKKAKAAATVPDNRPSVMEAVLTAVTEGPVTPAELAARVILLRPGTEQREIPKTAYAWKIKGRIEKRVGRWCLVDTQETPKETPSRASTPKAAGSEEKEPSIRHLIRTAIAKGQNPTADEIVERVQRAKPDLPASNIRTALGQLMISGEAKQTFGGQIVPVALKLPAATANGAH